MKNPFGQIVSFEDYVDIIGIPKEQLNSEEVKNRINKWLVQATEQFDSMISGNGQLGRLYRWFEKLEDNEEDNYKKYKLIKAICSWVETFVIKGKFWVDGLPVINSNVDIQINSSSNDSNVEAKRKDIIQDLVSVGLYQTTNFGDNNTFQDNQQNAEQLIEDLIVLSTSELQQNYLRLNPQKSLEGNLDFANNDLVNGGNIIGSTQQARNNIQYYNIIDSTIDLNRNTILGSLPQDPTTAADIAQINQNIANINQEQITQNTNISNNANEINSLKAKDIEQNNRLTQLEQETLENFNEIANIKTKDQQQDNSIQSNATSINANTNSINTLNQQVANNKNLLDQTIDGLRTLKPFEYVGEYQNGTSYKINQLVSYQNNLYLSKEDNNTTQPTSDKWLLLNEDTVSVDLSDYYNKLEVDSIKSNLQNDITTNTNNITTLTQEVNTNKRNITNLATVQNQHDQLIQQNQTNITANQTSITNLQNDYLSKTTTTPQTIASQITFTKTDMVLKFNSGTNNSAYLAGFKSNNQRVWYFGKGSSTSDNFIIGADRGVIKLEPSTHVDVSNKRIINVATPTAINDAANKQYVDNAIQNITPGSGGSIDTSNFATLNTNQTINGAKTFTNAITLGTTINAGLGGDQVKFIPDDNRTKTLQFYNNNATDTRRFNILIPEPTQANNPATKQYVDNNALSKTSTTAQTVAGPVSFTQPITVATPTQNNQAANKQYVDSEIARVNTGGNVPQQTLDQINNNTNKITAIETSITSLENQVNVNVNRIGTNTNSINQLNTKDTQNVKLSGNQTISGQKTFTNRIFANGGITNLIDPTNATDAVNKQYVDNNTLSKTATAFQTVASSVSFQRPITVQTPTANTDAANKQYVDRTVDKMINIYSDNTTKYSNLQTINVSNLLSRTNVNYTKPLIVSFTRYSGNNNTQLGTHTGIIYAGTGNKHMVISDTYVVQNGNMTDGRRAGLLITPSQIKVQCWDGNDRIGNITIYGWAKALS